MYKVFYHKRARKQLKKLPRPDQLKVSKKIRKLGHNPLDPALDVKPYHDTQKSWRVRIGDLRVIYLLDNESKVIYIEYLGYRGNVYKH